MTEANVSTGRRELSDQLRQHLFKSVWDLYERGDIDRDMSVRLLAEANNTGNPNPIWDLVERAHPTLVPKI
jgi:hypothetical protein